jgi:hypothetical protein
MLFIYPMWDHESQRIGKYRCTPLGYKLHGIAELLGFIGLFLLLVVLAYLGCRKQDGTFQVWLWWLLAAPLGVGLVSECLYCYSWKLAARRGFQYNGETHEASWMEGGQRQVYRWESGRTSEGAVADRGNPPE